MTLHDWFAGQCNTAPYDPFATYKLTNGTAPTVKQLAEYIAAIRYVEADAMLAQREQQS